MRRAVAWGCAVASILALAACGFARWPLSAARVGDSLNAAFGASPRLHWSAPQAATFSALPWPSLRIVDARLDDAGGVNLLRRPRPGSTCPGRARARAFHPHARHSRQPDRDARHRPPALRRGGAGLAAPASVAGALAPLTSLSLSNGFLRVVGARRGLDTLIADVQGRLDGLTVGNQLRFNLSAEWRNAPVAIAGVLSDPEAAAKGASSRFEFALEFAVGEICLRRRSRARGKAERRRRHDRVRRLRSPPGGSPQRFAAARPRRRRHRHLRQGQGGGGRAYARRCNDDQRPADALKGRSKSPTPAGGRPSRARWPPKRWRSSRCSDRRNACSTRPAGGARSRSRSLRRRPSTSTCASRPAASTSMAESSPTRPHPSSSRTAS